MLRSELQRIRIPKGSSKSEEKELLMEIEALQNDLNGLISNNAGFDEIYSLSMMLDRSLVRLYRIKAGRFAV